MLILTRKPGESLYIGDEIKITIVELKGHQIRVGITAPAEMRIYREEIYLQILEENKMAAEASQTDIGLEGLSAAWSETKGPAAAGGEAGGGEGDEGERKKPAIPSIRPLDLSARSMDRPRGPGLSAFVTSKSKGRDPEVVVKRKRSNKKPDE